MPMQDFWTKPKGNRAQDNGDEYKFKYTSCAAGRNKVGIVLDGVGSMK